MRWYHGNSVLCRYYGGFFYVKFPIERKRKIMPITEILKKNAELYPNDVALTEINPQFEEEKRTTWKE